MPTENELALFAFVGLIVAGMLFAALIRVLRRSGQSNGVAVFVAFLAAAAGWFIYQVVGLIMAAAGAPSALPLLMCIGVVLGGIALFKSGATKPLPKQTTQRSATVAAPKPEGLPKEIARHPTHDLKAAEPPAIKPVSTTVDSDLVRLVEGMMADGVFAQSEAEYLFQWLQENRHHLNRHPVSIIYQRLTEALADGVLDEDEADDLSELFQRLATNEIGVVAKVASSSPRPLPPPPSIIAPVPRDMAPPKPRARRKRASAGIDRILIQYEDSLGLDSEREVTVHSVDTFYLKGYCHMRCAPRTFRIDRIVGDIVRTETGEVLPVRKWRAAHAYVAG